MCALTSLKYEFWLKIYSVKYTRRKKKQDFRNIVLKDHTGNRK